MSFIQRLFGPDAWKVDKGMAPENAEEPFAQYEMSESFKKRHIKELKAKFLDERRRAEALEAQLEEKKAATSGHLDRLLKARDIRIVAQDEKLLSLKRHVRDLENQLREEEDIYDAVAQRRAEDPGRQFGDVWHWMGDGSDNLASLTCPVLIQPEALLDIIEKAERLEQDNVKHVAVNDTLADKNRLLRNQLRATTADRDTTQAKLEHTTEVASRIGSLGGFSALTKELTNANRALRRKNKTIKRLRLKLDTLASMAGVEPNMDNPMLPGDKLDNAWWEAWLVGWKAHGERIVQFLEGAAPSIHSCPRCFGLADNGFDRCDPPSAYVCTLCVAEEDQSE